MASKRNDLFKRLTQLFSDGPSVKRKVRAFRTPTASTAVEVFKKSYSQVYSNALNAYGQYDRMSRYADFSEMEYCLSGDTLIATFDGYKTIKELAETYGLDKSFYVYAYDHEKQQIVPALGRQARQTRVDEAFKVTFDSGMTITGTANHRLMLRDGTFKRIDELKTGDSMMPFYRRDFYKVRNNDTSSSKDSGDGYRWVYTANPNLGKNGWVAEHRYIAEWVSGKQLLENEVVHHKNFKKFDNNPENLDVMDAHVHHAFHAKILNGVKWSVENTEWIEKFKAQHSQWMKDNNPAERADITFGRILETCEKLGFNLYRVCEAFDTDPNVIKRKLRKHGFKTFETFASAYVPNWRNAGWDNRGEKNPRFDSSLTFQAICDAFVPGMGSNELCAKLGTTHSKISKRVKWEGYKNFRDFVNNYQNHKVVSVESVGVIPLYDLTVDGYKNFATDTVISHNTPEVASALDIYAEESTACDDQNSVLHVYSENPKIQAILDDLCHNVLNAEHNLTPWTRNLVKYGDFFLFIDIHPEGGVINVFPMPVNEVERDEGWDPLNPLAVRFRWVSQGNQLLESWQVAHFRLTGNDSFLPYGSSVLESGRRIWRQLILIEDAMLVYRVVRSPERRVFYIDVGTVPTEEIPNYMEAAQSKLKRSAVIDKQTGRVDLRYNPLSVDEDYFIPVRGSETGTKIDTLAGGQHVSDIADVEYIQKKLFAALKVPRAYLGYDESLSSKATLAQEDIRFSRSINWIQRVLISELEKICVIHLFAHGYEGEDLTDFSLFLSNPSTVAQMQKLELWRTKFEIAGTVPEGLVDRDFLRKELFKLTDYQIDQIKQGRRDDRLEDLELEASELEGNDPVSGGGGGGGGGLGGLGSGGGDDFGSDLESPEAGGDAGPPPEGGADDSPAPEAGGGDAKEDLFAGAEDESDEGLLTSSDDPSESSVGPLEKALSDISKASKPTTTRKSPANASPLTKYAYNQGRRRTHGARKTHIPDFKDMVSVDDDPFDKRHFRGSPFKDSLASFGEGRLIESLIDEIPGRKRRTNLSAEMHTMLSSLRKRLDSKGKVKKTPEILTETPIDEEVNIVIEEDKHLDDLLDGVVDVTIEADESES